MCVLYTFSYPAFLFIFASCVYSQTWKLSLPLDTLHVSQEAFAFTIGVVLQ